MPPGPYNPGRLGAGGLSGTVEDPIPYTPGMALIKDTYYREEQVVYRCIRDTGQAVYQKLKEFKGIYVEAV